MLDVQLPTSSVKFLKWLAVRLDVLGSILVILVSNHLDTRGLAEAL
jgi:hypothetical protein